jgi:hypothetical protein
MGLHETYIAPAFFPQSRRRMTPVDMIGDSIRMLEITHESRGPI